jgi:hypothetical protein
MRGKNKVLRGQKEMNKERKRPDGTQKRGYKTTAHFVRLLLLQARLIFHVRSEVLTAVFMVVRSLSESLQTNGGIVSLKQDTTISFHILTYSSFMRVIAISLEAIQRMPLKKRR